MNRPLLLLFVDLIAERKKGVCGVPPCCCKFYMLRPYCCFFNCQIKYFFLICHGAYFMLSFIYLSCIFIFSIDQVWSCSPLPLSSTFPTEGQLCLSPTSFSTVSALDGWKGTRVKKKFALGHTTAIELFRGMEVTAIFYNNI